MSSRALRRLQREREEKKQLESLQNEEADTEDDEVEDLHVSPPTKKINAFDLLEGTNDDEDDADEDEEELKKENQTSNSIQDEMSAPASRPPRSKKKKKKAKKKGKDKADRSGENGTIVDGEMDEIDRALKDLSTKNEARGNTQAGPGEDEVENMSWNIHASKLLSVDAKNLNPLTEMKSLFGSAAMETSISAPSRSQGRGQNEGVDLGTALTGRYSPASRGQELGSMASRRNIFMQGKAEWPRATSGGLGMELKSDIKEAEKTYRIVHNAAYTTTQQNFQAAVEMMQPERMIQLLQFNPYHIATLLQVSEIAKHQGDHSVSADLLERALYTFGRSVHSTFSVALRDGLARLDFDIPENRELWLTIWRYISNLGMRGTWRTAFEWSKILLSLSPLKDPYSVTLFIDQLALRGRQQEQLIRLCDEDAYGRTWAHLPNIQISLVLAHHRVKNSGKARRLLAAAIHKFPYIIARLFQELDLSPIPKSIWGSLPSTDAEKLFTELYVIRAKDLWNTPETTALLMEVAQSMGSYDLATVTSPPKLEISLEEARHVLLTETPALIGLLPRRFTNMPTSSSDPLPPPSSAMSEGFVPRAPGAQVAFPSAGEAFRTATNAGVGWFSRLMEWFQGPGQALEGEELGDAFQEALAAEGEEIPAPILEAFRNQQFREDDIHGDEETDSDLELPDLESMPEETYDPDRPDIIPEETLAQLRGPYTATVEDEDEPDNAPGTQAGDQLRPGHVLFNPSQPISQNMSSAMEAAATSESPSTTLSIGLLSDPQRVQRWLLSAGTEPLQPFLKKHGSDLTKWPAVDYPQEAVDNYYTAMMHLRATQRDWVINVLSQRDKPMAEMARSVVKVGKSVDSYRTVE